MPPGAWYWIILIGANTPLFTLLGWPVFGSWSEFGACLAATRRRRGWFRGGLTDLLLDDDNPFSPDNDRAGLRFWRQAKLLFFIAGCGSVVALEHFLIRPWFP